MAQEAIDYYVNAQPDYENAGNAYGRGIELDIFPILRFIPSETFRILQKITYGYERVTKKLLADRKVNMSLNNKA